MCIRDRSIKEGPCENPAIRCMIATARRPLSAMSFDDGSESVDRGSMNGGNARASEVMAFKALRAANMSLVASEEEVEYSQKCGCADMVVQHQELLLGVSVTRVYNYRANPLCFDSVVNLLGRKLHALGSARKYVKPEWSWDHQLMFVWVAREEDVGLVWDAWEQVGAERTQLFVVQAVDMPWIF
eukprot:TRINITY_DN1578_c0_g1_i4.p1 TRINITY_DN1578_c0_g1~~TRINITY_DN1578_c0_g1_i4.p1  ORF type:complete len:185 (+),score=30.18 TRINITY_DN1578_c0_g1_i4:176-730(+)